MKASVPLRGPVPATYIPPRVLGLDSIVGQIDAPREPVTFAFSFLKKFLGGSPVGDGEWRNKNSDQDATKPGLWCNLKTSIQSFLPKVPGENGASVSMATEGDENTLSQNYALFIADESRGEMHRDPRTGRHTYSPMRYTYFGQYSKPFWADMISYNEMKQHVPRKTVEHWIDQLARKKRRILSKWKCDILRDALLPQPVLDPEIESFNNYTRMITEWKQKRIDFYPSLEAEAISKMFERVCFASRTNEICEDLADFDTQEDHGPEPKLRLAWDYHQCIGYDRAFYDRLVEAQERYEAEAERRLTAPRRR